MTRALVWTIALLPLTVYAQDGADVLFRADFEKDTSGFVTLDPQATLSVTNDANTVHEGEGSLQLVFPQRAMAAEGAEQGLPGSILYPVAAPLDALQAVGLAVWCRLPTALGVVLTEGDNGPRYTGLVWCEGDQWDEAVLPLSRFYHDTSGPEDPNGKLDPGKINAIIILDVGVAFSAFAEGGLFHQTPPDQQTIWLDNYELLASVPEAQDPQLPDNVTMLNDFAAPLRGAFLLGGEDRTVDYDEGPEGGDCIRITYALRGNTILAIAQPLSAGTLDGAKSLRLHVKASAQTQLVIALEEGGDAPNLQSPSYAYVTDIGAAAPWKTLDIPLSEFQLDFGKADPDGKLNPEKVRSIFIGDASAMAEQGEVSNTLWLDDLVVVR